MTRAAGGQRATAQLVFVIGVEIPDSSHAVMSISLQQKNTVTVSAKQPGSRRCSMSERGEKKLSSCALSYFTHMFISHATKYDLLHPAKRCSHKSGISFTMEAEGRGQSQVQIWHKQINEQLLGVVIHTVQHLINY